MRTPALVTAAVITLLPFVLLSGCRKEAGKEGISTFDEFQQRFADPPAEYRSAPLWAWNDRITEEGIDFQLQEFKKAGIGGVFVHPRPGLLTEYLSDDWFRLFDHAVRKGEELGMKVWIYDENSYPSGFAGGHVPAEMPDSYTHGAGLGMKVQSQLNVSLSDTIAVVLKKTDTGFVDITASADRENGRRGTYYVFRKTYPERSPWFGGFPYVDLLYKGVTGKFLEITMTRGYERNAADFGKTVPGIFTDEPNLDAALSDSAVLRWTPDLWEAFRQRWGYDLRPHLPSLVEETGIWKKVRHDYYGLILELFVDRWARPWSAYCDEKHLQWTGHYWEHGWPEPTQGLDEAAFYVWHQMPGVDMLGNRLDTAGLGGQFGNERAVRELRSAANQAGRTRTLSETYGGGGWDMTFETQKRLVDWECVMGVNFVNQHLAYYSLNGVRKFDYPPSFSYHEPWWEYYRLMGDYIGRVSLAMSAGEQINRTLVLQPNTTGWMYFSRKVRNPQVDSIRDGFKNFVYRMEQHHLEYDLGSEQVLKQMGSVEYGILRVGHRDYSLVVIPAEMENIDGATCNLLAEYLNRNGKVLVFRKEVPMVDGEPSPRVEALRANAGGNWVVADGLDDPTAVGLLASDGFAMVDLTRNGMLYHQRRVLAGGGQLLFVVNSHPAKKASASLALEGDYVAKLDLVSGAVHRYPASPLNGRISFQVDLEPAGSALFAVTPRQVPEPEEPVSAGTETPVEATGGTAVKRESGNVLMVNYLDLKTAKAETRDVYFMNAMNRLYTENGVAMGNPWRHKIQYRKSSLELDTLFKAGSGFEAAYHFTLDRSLSPEAVTSIRAVVERPDLWSVRINGNTVDPIPGQWWIDRGLAEFPVGPSLRPGRNTLTLTAPRMNILAEVMPVYLLGEFLVRPGKQGYEIAGGEISAPGSWVQAGLPFYDGRVAYSRSFAVSKGAGGSFKVKLGRWKGTVAEVLVNGKRAGLIAWQPYEQDVTSLLQEGPNEITVKVTGSLRNTFGVFYQKQDSWIYGPGAWSEAPAKPARPSDYALVEYGLFEPFSLVHVGAGAL